MALFTSVQKLQNVSEVSVCHDVPVVILHHIKLRLKVKGDPSNQT